MNIEKDLFVVKIIKDFSNKNLFCEGLAMKKLLDLGALDIDSLKLNYVIPIRYWRDFLEYCSDNFEWKNIAEEKVKNVLRYVEDFSVYLNNCDKMKSLFIMITLGILDEIDLKKLKFEYSFVTDSVISHLKSVVSVKGHEVFDSDENI